MCVFVCGMYVCVCVYCVHLRALLMGYTCVLCVCGRFISARTCLHTPLMMCVCMCACVWGVVLHSRASKQCSGRPCVTPCAAHTRRWGYLVPTEYNCRKLTTVGTRPVQFGYAFTVYNVCMYVFMGVLASWPVLCVCVCVNIHLCYVYLHAFVCISVCVN